MKVFQPSLYTSQKYKKGSKKDELVFDILIHVSILALVLTVFFWMVIRPIATKAITHELKTAISNAVPSLPLSATSQSEVKKAIKALKDKYKNQTDKSTAVKNKWLLGANIMTVCLLFAILGGAWATLFFSCRKSVSLGLLLAENLILFTIIGFVEAVFFIFAAQKFVPVPPSTMGTTFVEKMEEKLS